MKILNITAQKPHSTGSGTYLTELVKSFDALGHEQAVVAGIYREDVVNFPAKTTFYPVYFDTFPIVGMSDVMPYESTRYRDMTPAMIEEFEAAFLAVIRRAVEEFKPDIILCHHLFLLTSIVRKNFPEQKVYAICHGTCLRQMVNGTDAAGRTGSAWAIDIEEIRKNIAGLDRIFALHDEQAKEIERIFGITENNEGCFTENSDGSFTENYGKISVIGSGYSPALFNTIGRKERIHDPVRIIYAGKISTPKGVPELLEALNQLDEERDAMPEDSPSKLPPFRATLVGGCQEPALAQKCADQERHEWCMAVEQPVLAEMYKQHDILVLPSYFEGLSLVPIEAMACGLIPICTDLPGMKKWINENVKNANVRYLPMPEMASIDTPTEAGREAHIAALTDTLRIAINDVWSGKSEPQPDTSKITWDEVAKKVLA